jgi:hypothetical protein
VIVLWLVRTVIGRRQIAAWVEAPPNPLHRLDLGRPAALPRDRGSEPCGAARDAIWDPASGSLVCSRGDLSDDDARDAADRVAADLSGDEVRDAADRVPPKIR